MVENHVVWKPIPNTSQVIALDTRAQQTLYCGTRGPGKTLTQLMRFRKRVGIGYGSFWRGIILDRKYKNLDDLVSQSKRWYTVFGDGAEFLTSNTAYKWVWPTGEELLFRAVTREEDYWDYHGQEFPFIGWNELTKHPNDKLYMSFMSCNRSSFTPEKDAPKDKTGVPTLPNIPLEVFSTTNSWGVGHHWVKAKFIDPAPYGQMVKSEIEVFNPRTQANEVVVRTQVAIFGSYRENIYLDPIYVATLKSEPDENKRKAWLLGDWNIVAGGAFDDVWRADVHIKQRFKVPNSWHLDRSFDWGSTHPYWVGWWAEANGEEAKIVHADGEIEIFCPVAKSLVLIHELYGTEKIGSNKGLHESPTTIANKILVEEAKLKAAGWISARAKVHAGPADNQISNNLRSDAETIEKTMKSVGVKWTKSDKSQGSRINGFELLRDMLMAARLGVGRGIYTMVHNRASVGIIPNLPRDPDNLDDVDSEAEDHPYDGWRYRALARIRRAAKDIKVKYANAR